MMSAIGDFLSQCQSTDFGKGEFSNTESAFYQRFNGEVVSLCRSLPESAQTDSILFLIQYARASFATGLDFFANYYPPSWSILYWLCHGHSLPIEQLTESDVTNAVRGQSMAMFLHSLDDHLTDGQVPVSPLTLFLRSQAWALMTSAFSDLAYNVPEGEATVRQCIDNYYASIQYPVGAKSLDEYCSAFRKQMAIWFVAPTLLSLKMTGVSDFTRDLQMAYGSFGIAWRLLDDIRDIDEDIQNRTQSALYFCLPEKMRERWNQRAPRSQNFEASHDSSLAILSHMREHNVVDHIKKMICSELASAASIAEAYRLTGLAQEFRCLAQPLESTGNT